MNDKNSYTIMSSKFSITKFIQFELSKEELYLDLKIALNLDDVEIKMLLALIMAVQKLKSNVFTRQDMERYLIGGYEFGINCSANILEKNIHRLVDKGYILFVGNEPLGKNRMRSLSKYTIIKPKLDYFAGFLKCLGDRKYDCYQTILNYKIEENLMKLIRKDVVKHKRNMRILKKMK